LNRIGPTATGIIVATPVAVFVFPLFALVADVRVRTMALITPGKRPRTIGEMALTLSYSVASACAAI
jgi:hypothetical protein